MNITDAIRAQAANGPTRPALILKDRDISYRQLLQQSAALAAYLMEQGVKTGQVVALRLRDPHSIVLTMLALARIGATSFSLSLTTPVQRERDLQARVKARWLIGDRIESDRCELPLILLTADDPTWRRSSGKLTDPVSNPEAPWAIIHGSGSTGNSKLLPIGQRQMLERMKQAKHWLPYGEQDRLLPLVDLAFHMVKQRILETLAIGATVLLPEPEQLSKRSQLLQLPATVVFGTVLHFERILAHLPPSLYGCWNDRRALWVTSSTVSGELRQRLRDQLCGRVYVTYGTNETGTSCRTGPPDVFDVPGTVGRLIPGFDLEVVDAQDRPLPRGQVGVVRFRSASTIEGYLDDEEATKTAFRQGWFYPGDRVRLTEDGQLIHLGRADKMMVVNGINIDPAEVQHCLLTHPAIAEAVVLALPDPVHQDRPVAAVVLKVQATATAEHLLNFVHQKLGSIHLTNLWILEQLPRSEVGKLQRRELMAQLQQFESAAAAEAITSIPAPQPAPSASRPLALPPFRVVAALQPPSADELEHLDPWLLGLFATAKEAPWLGHPLPREQERGTVLAWIDRALLLANTLLQIAQIPIFAKPQLQALTAPQPHWHAIIDFPLIEELPAEIYRTALQQAFSILSWMGRHAPDSERRASLFHHMEQVASQQLAIVLPAGKSRIPVLKIAHQLGIPFLHLGHGIFQLGWGAKARRMDRSSTELDSHMGAQLSHSKLNTAQLLRLAGFPHAVHGLAATAEAAQELANGIGWPIVVKPADADRGEGVTVGISDGTELAEAFAFARDHSPSNRVLVEQQVPGTCHRLFIAEGKLLYAVKRLPIGVYGDGQLSLRELVALARQREAERPPWQREPFPELDARAEATIVAAGFTADSIPELRQFVALRPIETTAWGGIDEDVSTRVHPDNQRLAIDVAELFGLNIAGIDIISSDLATPWYQNGAIINEVNFAPVLGDGAVARRQIPVFLQGFIDGQGRIPVHVFVGGAAALQMARDHHACLHAAGVAAVLTTAGRTWDAPDRIRPMAIDGLFGRARALLLWPKLAFLLLVLQSDELLHCGMPLDRVDVCHWVDDDLSSHCEPASALAAPVVAALRSRLRHWSQPAAGGGAAGP